MYRINMSCSKAEQNNNNNDKFAFLSFIKLEKWEKNKYGEQCICSLNDDDCVPIDNCFAENRHRGEVAIDIGMTRMGISEEKRRALINQWCNELGKGYSDWLSHENWYTYIYYKFMAWRILQVKYSKKE